MLTIEKILEHVNIANLTTQEAIAVLDALIDNCYSNADLYVEAKEYIEGGLNYVEK